MLRSHFLAIALTFALPLDVFAQAKPGEERSFEIADGVKMVFCWIPAGEAQLGSPKSERADVLKAIKEDKEPTWLASEAEDVRGKFKTKGFWMAKYTVTQREYESVVGSNPSWFAKGGTGKDKVEGIDTSRFPVERVSWDDCQAFLKKCKLKGLKLPHEDDWEYAYRGGKGNKQPFYWGDELNGDKANCDGNYPFGTSTKGAYLERPTPVGSYASKAAHPWGLCDMSGNVWQWCDNWYDSEQKYRVLRGGSWSVNSGGCRAAYRNGGGPDPRDDDFGFRVCFRQD